MNQPITAILASGPEESFDRTTRLITRLFQAPIALITFVDAARQSFKSQVGLGEPWATSRQTPLSHSFCQIVVKSGEPLRVVNAVNDRRVCDNLAISDLGVIAYLGAPLRLNSGEVVGALCAIDTTPRNWTNEELQTLEDLAAGVVSEIELRLALQTSMEGRLALTEAQRLLGMAEEFAGIGRWSIELPSKQLYWSEQVYRIYGLPRADARPDLAIALAAYHPDDRDRVEEAVTEAISSGRPFELLCRLRRPDGSIRYVLSKGEATVNQSGNVVSVGGIFLDITDLTVAEQEVRRRGDVLEATLANMEQGLVMIAADGTLQIYNRRFRELLDIPEEVLRGMVRFDDVLDWLSAHGEYDNLPAEERGRIVSHGAPLTFGSYERLRPNGRWLEVSTVRLESGGAVRTYSDITEKRESDAARRSLQEQFRIIAENSHDLIYLKPQFDGPKAYVSPSVERILGLRPDEFSSLPPEILVHPEDLPALSQAIQSLDPLSSGRTLLYRMRHKDGRWIWMETTWAAGESALVGPCILVTGRDVSERVAIESARANSEARYRLLAETTSDVITELNLNFQRVYVSPSCRRLFGFEPEEMLGQMPSTTMHPDDAPAVRQLASQLVEGKTGSASATTTYRMRHKAGHWVWVEAILTLLSGPADGQPASIVCSLRDVSERKEAELALAKSERRFRLLAEHASDMIILADLDTTWRYVSPAAFELVGYHADELLGHKPLEWVHPEDVDHYARLLTALQSGAVDSFSSRQRCRHSNGDWIWVEEIVRLMKGPDGLPTGYVAAVRDISEQQRHETELKAAMATAEAASRAKTDFLATMSHEIRTPLNGILGFTELLLEEENLSVDHRRKISRIKSAGSALLTVVNDVLDFSRIEAGEIEIACEDFSVRALLDNAASIVRGLAEAKKLRLKIDCDTSVPDRFIGDEARIRQILLNFLNNAIKFTFEGEITVTAASEGGSGNSQTLRFAVTDTGIGIPADKRDRLFQRFSQLDSSIARIYGGSGLGLAISKSLVEMMGGQIGLHSEEGEGSTFWFRVTLVESDGSRALGGVEVLEPPGRKLRLLLAEDLEINQEIAVSALRKLGHDVDVVPDGASAVMAVDLGIYDAVLMDVQMPVMDGIAATKIIRENEAGGTRIPIIAMTANVLPSQVTEFQEAGMDAHVGKPFKKGDLARALAPYSAPALVTPADHDGTVAPAVAPAFDAATFAEFEEAIGPEEARLILIRLCQQVSEAGTWSKDMKPSELGNAAHRLVSPTGMLGFIQLSECCRAIETACLSGEATSHLLADLKNVLNEALSLMRDRTQSLSEAA